MDKFVAYYRVSTVQQGRSGLGLDAQRSSVRVYLESRGWPPVAEFTEIESGRNNHRPELAQALRLCRIHSATLVIAKLDRLARNAAFLLNLKDAGVDFVAVDMPEANRLTVGIMALIAEDEADRISQRTKAALAEAKRRGVKLGNPQNLSNTGLGTRNSAQARARKAGAYAIDVHPLILEIRRSGVHSLSAIATELSNREIPTPRGLKSWSAGQVRRIEKRVAEEMSS